MCCLALNLNKLAVNRSKGGTHPSLLCRCRGQMRRRQQIGPSTRLCTHVHACLHVGMCMCVIDSFIHACIASFPARGQESWKLRMVGQQKLLWFLWGPLNVGSATSENLRWDFSESYALMQRGERRKGCRVHPRPKGFWFMDRYGKVPEKAWPT